VEVQKVGVVAKVEVVEARAVRVGVAKVGAAAVVRALEAGQVQQESRLVAEETTPLHQNSGGEGAQHAYDGRLSLVQHRYVGCSCR